MVMEVFAAPDKLLLDPIIKKMSTIIHTTEEDPVPTQGVVVSVGCLLDEKAWLGKEVIFKPYSVQKFHVGGADYISLLPEEVLASVK